MDEKQDLAPKKLETACEISGKALLQLVPSLGPLLASVIGDIQNLRKEARFLEFLDGLKEDLEGLQQHVNKDFIAKEDFVDITEENHHYKARRETCSIQKDSC